MVPMPELTIWDAFSLWLEEQCRERQCAVLRGETDNWPVPVAHHHQAV
ncbi:hypothetical protein JC607_15175 [Paracoccus sp. IB05]|nr:hypothetical protein [Paracoccus sp. IB05]